MRNRTLLLLGLLLALSAGTARLTAQQTPLPLGTAQESAVGLTPDPSSWLAFGIIPGSQRLSSLAHSHPAKATPPHLPALDMKAGAIVWDVTMQDYRSGYASTIAPIVVKDKVIVGVAGGEFGIRGFIDAYEAQTGKRAWRFYTIPGPGESGHETWAGDSWKIGGVGVWVTGAYDPEQNLLFYGTGNPGPDYHSESREGDNLYSTSLVALDADTGDLR